MNFTLKEDESHKNLTICLRHRDAYGLRWRCNNRSFAVPQEMAAHKPETGKGDQGVDDNDDNDNDDDDDDDDDDVEIKDNQGTFSVCEREGKPHGDVSLTRGKGKDGSFLVCP